MVGYGDTMDANEYQRLAMRTLNPELDRTQVLTNAVMGLSGESGEATDIVKRHLFQGHELDREALAAELGDVCWYVAEAATALGLELSDVLEANIAKLQVRYPEGFDSDRSINRK